MITINPLSNNPDAMQELRFVDAHKKQTEIALAKYGDPRVKTKYLWLKDYHNKSVEEHGYSAEHKI